MQEEKSHVSQYPKNDRKHCNQKDASESKKLFEMMTAEIKLNRIEVGKILLELNRKIKKQKTVKNIKS